MSNANVTVPPKMTLLAASKRPEYLQKLKRAGGQAPHVVASILLLVEIAGYID
jgi:hypothetical protein